MKKVFTLSADERIKSRKTIGLLFNNGKSFSSGPIKGLFLLETTNETQLKCGFTVSSKSFKKAVQRNRIKRLMREAYRLQKTELKNLVLREKISLSIFMIFRGAELPEYKVIYQKMGEILFKILNMANEKTPKNS